MSHLEREKEIADAMDRYYTAYYCKDLGIPKWKNFVEARRDEETRFSGRILDWMQNWTSINFQGKQCLVVGGGTGAETFALIDRGAKVSAIEPNVDAVRIIGMKAKHRYSMENPCVEGIGEKLPFETESFDAIICITVLEHTQNPMRCLDEMVRVLRPGGWMFLITPDYRGLYEQHYKMFLPLFLPRWILKILLRLKKRPEAFLDTLQFVTVPQIRRQLQKHPVTAFHVLHPIPQIWEKSSIRTERWMYWWASYLGIQRDQYWLVQKNCI